MYVDGLARHLPADIELHVLTPLRDRMDTLNVSSRDYVHQEELRDNVKVHFISRANDTFMYNAGFQYACMRKVPQFVEKEGIDLIHSHTAHMPDLLLPLRKVKVPVLTTIHTTIEGQRQGTRRSGTSFRSLSRSEKGTLLLYPLLRCAEEVYFRGQRTYITQSQWMKDRLLVRYRWLRDLIEVVHTSVDTEVFRPDPCKIGDRDDVILFTGRLIASKGIDRLIEAIPKVVATHRDAKFLFIGPGDAASYQTRLAEIGVPRRNFAFLGYLDTRQRLADYYRTASIYVAPTLYENLPAGIIEAMASGTPVVASNVCGIPEAIQDGYNGVLIPPNSTRKLAEAICYLLENREERETMGKNARQTVEQGFSHRVNVPKILNVYNEITG